jgi:AbrB family looped-hinge helix DNA binding protein
MKSTISTKGQITVPAALRESLGLRPGTPVIFESHPRGALIRKGTKGEHPVDLVFGTLHLESSVDATLDALRGPRPKNRQGAKRRR